MSTITTKDGTQIYDKDWGIAPKVLLCGFNLKVRQVGVPGSAQRRSP